jgi:hypothetical protein
MSNRRRLDGINVRIRVYSVLRIGLALWGIPGWLNATETASSQERHSLEFANNEARGYLKRLGFASTIVTTCSISSKLKPEELEVVVAGSQVSFNGGSRYAVLQSVYRSMHNAGCRFLSPAFGYYEDEHEIVRQKARSNLALLTLKRMRPAFKYRKLYVEEGLSHTTDSLRAVIDWMPKAGFNVLAVPLNYNGRRKVMWDKWRDALAEELDKRGILLEVGGHGFQNFLNANMGNGSLFVDHPDWFGMDDKQRRRKGAEWVFCTSNAEACVFLCDNIITYLRERPEIAIFDFWPPDGAKWCACSECTKLGKPADRQVLLLERLRTTVDKVKLPVQLEIIAYSDTLHPPTRKVPPQTMVDFCPIAQSFEGPLFEKSNRINAKYASALRDWRSAFQGDLCLYGYYRRYAWKSLPVLLPRLMGKEVQWYAHTLKLQGISTYAEPGDWASYELNHYVLGQLAVQPTRSVDNITAEFCNARYGNDGRLASQCLTELETISRTYSSIPGVRLKSAKKIITAREKLLTYKQSVEQALALAQGTPTAAALMRLRMMLDYALKDLSIQEGRTLAQNTEELRGQVRELMDFIAQNADSGTFIVNPNRNAKSFYKHYGLDADKE